MKTTNKEVKAILSLIEIHIKGLRQEAETKYTRYRASAKKWAGIKNKLSSDFKLK